MARDALASLKPAPFDTGFENARVGSPSAPPTRAEAAIRARRRGEVSLKPPSATAVPAATEIGANETDAAPRRAPLDGDLIRRRWRSLIGRHPPKTLSHALMDRILAWREQVAEGGDISPRSRAILAAALGGKTAGGRKDDQAHDGDARSVPRPQPRAQVRVGTALVREHAGVLHRVTVTPEGFEWEGRIFASLSAVARAITGVRWNGRRFFALDRASKPGARNASEGGDANSPRASRRTLVSYRTGDAP